MEIEVRGQCVKISGYVNAVERDSRVLPAEMCRGAKSEFVEKVSAGAFARAIAKNPDVRLMFNHARDIGGVKAGTLSLSEDNIGLRAEALITDAEVVRAAENHELRGWSFGFTNVRDKWDNDGNISRRTLLDFDLLEVSVLTKTPAYIGTSVEMRGENVVEVREFRKSEDVEVSIEINVTVPGQQDEVPVIPEEKTTEKNAPSDRRDFYSNNLRLLKLKGEA